MRTILKLLYTLSVILVFCLLPIARAVAENLDTICVRVIDCALYDDTCTTSPDSSPTISGDLQSLAKQILDNKNITYDPGVIDNFKRLAAGQKAQTDPGREVDVQPIILVTILHLAQGHKVGVSSLTDGNSHTLPTNPHGAGKAVDINTLDGSHTNGSDEVANKIINTAAEVLPAGARFGMGKNPFGNKTINGKAFSSFADFPTHTHIDVMGVNQAANDKAVEAAGSGSGTSANPTAGGQDSAGVPKAVFIVGDSITERSDGEYKKAFADKQIAVSIDASTSRGINTGGTTGDKLSGVEAIKQHQDEISHSGAVVVALGTNGGANKNTIDDVISAIKKSSSNGSAFNGKIYWVDTISVGRSDNYNDQVIGPANKAIYANATSEGYQVVSWFKAVDKAGDPKNPTSKEKDPNNYITPISKDDLGVHPTPEGSTALAKLVAAAVSGSLSDPVGQTSNCCPQGDSSGSSTLTGKGPGEQVFNYFVGKGLSNDSAAAVTGNLQVESWNWGYINKWGGGGGNYYGLAQWDKVNRYPGLVRFAHGDANPDLATQLDYVWHELNGNYKSTLQNLKGNSSLTDKAIFWGRNYEGAVNADGSLQAQSTRIEFAKQWAKKAGGGSGASTGANPATDSGPSGGSTCGASPTTPGEYKSPFHGNKGVGPSRIDEGVDYYATSGSVPVYAIGNGVIKIVTDQSTFFRSPTSGHADWITYQLSDGPAKDKYIYVSESCTINPDILSGKIKKVDTNTKLCDMLPASIEMGWALDDKSQAAAAHSVYDRAHDGYETAYGVNFHELMLKLGAPKDHLDTRADPNGTVLGTLPKDWPRWK